ncbi:MULTISPECIES: VOC family protein [unclassified Thioalkalivibrio]|uniref:VOC family protein n=1 Tax=unclassified Thioalkalivibrio TaxID=2621013 RepID=UPI000370245E|nr:MULTISPECIES: VOC family protein [unclassified Thioalkalivibrio]
MAANPVVWFEIPTEDIGRARAFYETVLDMSLTQADTRAFAPSTEIWMFPMEEDQPGCAGALVQGPDNPVGSGGCMVYFGCDDCGIEAERVATAGGSIESPKESIGDYGFCVIARDPDGNRFGLHSMR